MNQLKQLAELLKARSKIEVELAGLLGQTATPEHIGAYIAGNIFGIVRRSAANAEGEGYFARGPLAGRSVTVKWSIRQPGGLAVEPGSAVDYYLVLAGPPSGGSRPASPARPWAISSVYLFSGSELAARLGSRSPRPGGATTLRGEDWQSAEIYPAQRNQTLLLSDEQRALLTLFA